MKPALVLVSLLLCIALAHVLYGGIGGGALLGFDGFPLIAASRAEGLAGLFGILTDELMGGRYPDGSFYRPLVHLSFAVDDWMGGGSLDPTVFRRTDVVVAGTAAALLGGVAARLTSRIKGPEGIVSRAAKAAVIAAGVVTALTFLVHRAQLDVVPYAPRRADALCVFFLAAAVFEALAGKRVWSVAVLSACAFFAKETGAIAVPLVAAASLSAPDRKRAIVLASAVAVAVSIGLRTVVLGGLGGHAESGTSHAVDSAAAITSALWQLLSAGTIGGAPVVVAAVVILTACLGLNRQTGRGTVAITVTWSLAILAITAFSGRAHMWYVVALLPGVSILSGVAVGAAIMSRTPAAIVAGATGVALSLNLMAASGSGPQSEALRVAGPIATDQVERFKALVEAAQPGSRTQLAPYVFGVAAGQGAPPVFLHADYSLQALADLLRPDLDVIVTAPGRAPANAAAAIIELVPGPPPADAIPH